MIAVNVVEVIELTVHLLSIERIDWPKLHDMFIARDANNGHQLLVEFPVRVCALYLLFINSCHDVAGIESRCVMKAKHVLLLC